MKKLLMLIAIFAMVAVYADKSVTVKGEAPNDSGGAREQALTNALREAVRQGIGIDIVSETKIQNFQLDYDRVMTKAFGYVKSYEVLSQTINKHGDYVVEIKASVAAGQPGVDELAAYKFILERKGAPRLLIKVNEDISKVKTKSPITLGLLKELALKAGFKVVSEKQLNRTRSRRGRRDAITGDKENSEARLDSVMGKCDVLLEVNINGGFGGIEDLYGIEAANFSLGVEYEVIWPNTGETIVQWTLPSESVSSATTSPEGGARDALIRLLKGEIRNAKGKGAKEIFSKIIAKWITELDLGTTMQVEFSRINRADIKSVMGKIKEHASISNVWLREFDSKLYSMVEVETRLNSEQLIDEILKHVGTKFDLDRSSGNYLQFAPKK